MVKCFKINRDKIRYPKKLFFYSLGFHNDTQQQIIMSYGHEEVVINEQDQKSIEREKSDKIKVSSNRSVFYYVDLAAESLAVFPEVELSGLGFGKYFLIIFGCNMSINLKLFTECVF